jgi:hypothetical protein
MLLDAVGDELLQAVLVAQIFMNVSYHHLSKRRGREAKCGVLACLA